MHFAKKTLPLVLGLTVPVLALVGCPIPGLGTNPTPTPTTGATATPVPPRAKLVVTKIVIPTTSLTDRAVTVKNLSGADIADLGNYIVSYEYEAASGSTKVLKMQHLRFGKGAALAKDAVFTFNDVACSGTETKCVTKETALGGSGAETMGIQTGGGSLVIYKTDATAANQHDYVQYGDAPATKYTHVDDAVAQKNWDDAAKYGPKISVGATGISAKTAGGTGSTNWQ